MGPARAHPTRRARQVRGCPSDLSDAQWQVIALPLPPERPGRRGRPRVWLRWRVIEAILYLDRTGCAWRYLSADFPPWQTVCWYSGKFATWAATLEMTLCIVAKRDRHAFEVLPRRWVVERTFAWISKHRRTIRDYEYLPASHEAMILWAMSALMIRRLAQTTELPDTHLDAWADPGSFRKRRIIIR